MVTDCRSRFGFSIAVLLICTFWYPEDKRIEIRVCFPPGNPVISFQGRSGSGNGSGSVANPYTTGRSPQPIPGNPALPRVVIGSASGWSSPAFWSVNRNAAPESGYPGMRSSTQILPP